MLGIGEQSRPAQRTSDCNQPEADICLSLSEQLEYSGSSDSAKLCKRFSLHRLYRCFEKQLTSDFVRH